MCRVPNPNLPAYLLADLAAAAVVSKVQLSAKRIGGPLRGRLLLDALHLHPWATAEAGEVR